MPSTNQFDNNGHASARQSARSAAQPGRGAAPTISASGSVAIASGHHQPHAVTPQTAGAPTAAPASSRHYRPQAYYDTPAPAATAQQTGSSASSQQYYRQAQQQQQFTPAPPNPSASNHPKGPAAWQANERHLRDVFRLNEVHLRNLPNLPPFNGDTRQGLPFDLQHITMLAIHSDSRQCLSLQDIYKAIETRYPDITARKPAWKESIRHRLSFKTRFCKIDRPVTHQGRGGYWYFDCTLPDDTKRPHRRSGAGDADAGSGSEDGSEGSAGTSMTSTRAQPGAPASQTAYSSSSSSSSSNSSTNSGLGGVVSPSPSIMSMSSEQYMSAGMNQPYGSYPMQQQQQQQMAYGAYMLPTGSPSMASMGTPASGQWTTGSMSTPGNSSVGGYQAYSSVSPLSASQTSTSSSSSNGSRSSRGSGSSHGSQMSSYSHHHYRGQ